MDERYSSHALSNCPKPTQTLTAQRTFGLQVCLTPKHLPTVAHGRRRYFPRRCDRALAVSSIIRWGNRDDVIALECAWSEGLGGDNAVGIVNWAATIKAVMLAARLAIVIQLECNSDEQSNAVLSAVAM